MNPGTPRGWSVPVLGSLAVAGLAGVSFLVSTYPLILMTEILIMGIFALGFNLLFGYTGLLSFGQAGFFGAGAYLGGLLLRHGPESLPLALLAGTGGAALLALPIGALCVRRDEIFFAILTLGFGMMLHTVAFNWREVTGGSDGLTGFPVPPLSLAGMQVSLFHPRHMFLFVLGCAALVALLLWRAVNSPSGLLLRAVRENKERLAFVGGNVPAIRLSAFVAAGAVSGLAGILFALFNRVAAPDMAHWTFSARPVLMTILGGTTTFLGPLAGAAVFFTLEHLVTKYTQNWMIFLGSILVPLVILFPQGILGSLVSRLYRARRGS